MQLPQAAKIPPLPDGGLPVVKGLRQGGLVQRGIPQGGEELQQAIDLQATSLPAWEALAMVQQASGDQSEAAETYEKLVSRGHQHVSQADACLLPLSDSASPGECEGAFCQLSQAPLFAAAGFLRMFTGALSMQCLGGTAGAGSGAGQL